MTPAELVLRECLVSVAMGAIVGTPMIVLVFTIMSIREDVIKFSQRITESRHLHRKSEGKVA